MEFRVETIERQKEKHRAKHYKPWTLKKEALLPYLDVVLWGAVAYVASEFLLRGGAGNGLELYLLYVLLVAALRGQLPAVAAVVLATGGYLMQRAEYRGVAFHGRLDREASLWVLQVFLVGMVVGWMKDQLQAMRAEYERELADRNDQLEDLVRVHEETIQKKQSLEQQVINQRGSLGRLYQLTTALNQNSPEEVLSAAGPVLAELMETTDAAVYRVTIPGSAQLVSTARVRGRAVQDTILYAKWAELNCALNEQSVFINRTLEKDCPQMVCGVYPGGRMQALLVLWRLPWEHMNLAQANRLQVASCLVRDALLRAEKTEIASLFTSKGMDFSN